MRRFVGGVRQRTALSPRPVENGRQTIPSVEGMMRLIPSILGLTMLCALPASGAEVIGEAVSVVPAAFSESDGLRETLEIGADVVRDAFVRTSKGGRTSLRFRDASMLEIGPGSRVKLDRFVYKGEASFRSAGVLMLKGGFRWASGHSPKSAYDLRTPTASIGIRGTVLDLRVSASVTIIRVLEGAIRACASERPVCIEATPETGPVRITKTSATLDRPSRIDRDSPRDTPAAKPRQRRAERAAPNERKARFAQSRLAQSRLAEARPPRQKKRRGRVIYLDEPTVHIEEDSAPAFDTGIMVDIGIGLLGHALSHRQPRILPRGYQQ
jgi:hypothetical protein